MRRLRGRGRGNGRVIHTHTDIHTAASGEMDPATRKSRDVYVRPLRGKGKVESVCVCKCVGRKGERCFRISIDRSHRESNKVRTGRAAIY